MIARYWTRDLIGTMDGAAADSVDDWAEAPDFTISTALWRIGLYRR